MRGLRAWLMLAVLIAAAASLSLRLPTLFLPVALPPLALPRTSADPPPAPAIDRPVLPGAEALEPAFERPPLHRSRRPYEEPAVPEPARAAPAPLDAALWGIVTSGDERFAVLARRGAPEGVRVREGDSFEDWRVIRIGESEVVLQRGDRTETIRLAFGPAPGEDGGR